ncbi:MAG: hypothetical protein A3A24_02530 [Candidatus Buchananbacteria bacterium RIFCSPLOWO2_01_FULL_46_12]|uniref:Prepilin-type N-terminal cleavage/methylation domain-containing protein n=1 Tax=Candidatus Buchananbacteria bacterium RIFCSPLOWO2_01_FULL_46_12 TaxID=1797546 RepID=A0A1G1YN91_9BACT|nr:MAG: hypothetical protein A3A24_02530 [Candidatus Buchananbacteria bacterium RIFCSPLOWO2_01_FULL_46_12]
MIGNNLKPKRNLSHIAGFTLLEMLVVVSLFSILVMVITDVYLLSLRSQRQTSMREQTLSSVRYAMETIARSVRTAEINYWYAGYPTGNSTNPNPLATPEDELALIDQNGRSIVYHKSAAGALQADIDGQVYNLTDVNNIDVVNLDFYIGPSLNPFYEERCNQNIGPDGCSPTSLGCTVDNPTDANLSGFCRCTENSQCLKTHRCDFTASEILDQGLCLPFNEQPRVTIVMGFTSKSPAASDQNLIFLQTTISSRVYKR